MESSTSIEMETGNSHGANTAQGNSNPENESETTPNAVPVYPEKENIVTYKENLSLSRYAALISFAAIICLVLLVGMSLLYVTASSRKTVPDAKTDAKTLIQLIRPPLDPHVEGGAFVETWRTGYSVFSSKLNGTRSAATSIYYLLRGKQFSAFHILSSDEMWFWHSGCDVLIHCINGDGSYEVKILGNILTNRNASFQVLVESGIWFAAELADTASYALTSTVVAPGFEYADFRLGNKTVLMEMYANYSQVIDRLS